MPRKRKTTRSYTESQRFVSSELRSSPLAKPKKATRAKSNTRRWEDEGDNDGMAHAVNPKPKFVMSTIADPVLKKRKAKPKPKDPKRALKAGETRGTAAQRKSTAKKIRKSRMTRRRTRFLDDN